MSSSQRQAFCPCSIMIDWSAKVTQLITDSSVQVPAARTKAGVKSRPSSAFFLQANHK
jgi:hypothetical protein